MAAGFAAIFSAGFFAAGVFFADAFAELFAGVFAGDFTPVFLFILALSLRVFAISDEHYGKIREFTVFGENYEEMRKKTDFSGFFARETEASHETQKALILAINNLNERLMQIENQLVQEADTKRFSK